MINMLSVPNNFNDKEFAEFYGLSSEPYSGDYWIDGNGFFQCPALPDLTEDDLAQFTSILPEPSATIEQEIDALKLVVGMLIEDDANV